MAFDIHGNDLKPGHCEVHPNIPEEYPCVMCTGKRIQEQLKQQKEQQLQETKKRKVVQLAVLNEVPSGYPELFALTDDGHIYSRKIIESEYEPWEKLSGVPQD